MDETPELQMETDVSSTTGDVSETQQLSGSHGDVEMVIVVETVKEEDEASSDKKSSPSKSDDNDSTPSTKDSPQKDLQSQKTVNSPNTEIQVTDMNNKNQTQKTSPIKDTVTTNVSQKAQSKDFANSSSNLNQTANTKKTNDLASDDIQIVDITKNIQPQKSNNPPNKDLIQNVQIQKTTSKDIQIVDISKTQPHKAVISATKNIQIIDIRQKGQTQKNIISPTKDLDQKKTLKVVSPVKDVQIKEQSQKMLVSQPVKSVELQNNEMIVDSPSETLNLNEDKDKLNTENVESSTSPTPQTSSNTKSPVQSTEDTQKSEERTETLDGDSKDDKRDELVFNTSIDICEKSNDSQTNSDISEKDHNKSISRELKSLIKSAKESKIISECTQLTTKTRKSRVNLDGSVSLNTSVEADRIQGVRRSSNNSQKSNCSEKSEVAPKRSMRSQNPEFVNKVKQFLNSVTGKNHKESDDEEIDEHKKDIRSESVSPSPKKKKQLEASQPEIVSVYLSRQKFDILV